MGSYIMHKRRAKIRFQCKKHPRIMPNVINGEMAGNIFENKQKKSTRTKSALQKLYSKNAILYREEN